MLSHRLPVLGLVGRYLTNNLMGRETIHWWPKPFVTGPQTSNHMRY